jgi:hypothetical protein
VELGQIIRHRVYVRAGRPKNRCWIPSRVKLLFAFPQGPSWSVKWRLFLQCQSGRDVNLTTHLHPLPKLNINEALLPISQMSSFFFRFLMKRRDNFVLVTARVHLYLVTWYLAKEYAHGFHLILRINKDYFQEILIDWRTYS